MKEEERKYTSFLLPYSSFYSNFPLDKQSLSL